MFCQDRDNLTGLYETKLISEGIHAAWFNEKKALGVEFSNYFKPISVVTIALVLTAASVLTFYSSTNWVLRMSFRWNFVSKNGVQVSL